MRGFPVATFGKSPSCNVLKDKSRKLGISIGNIDKDFPIFCEFIGAKGDIRSAMLEFVASRNEAGARAKALG